MSVICILKHLSTLPRPLGHIHLFLDARSQELLGQLFGLTLNLFYLKLSFELFNKRALYI